MAARSAKLYEASPTMERDEDGNMAVKKPKKEDVGKDGSNAEMEGGHEHHAHHRREMHHRHMHEHMALHHRHEIEHAGHKGGDKKMMHERHQGEFAEMHSRHHHEMKKMHGHHEKTGGGMIEKVESKK